MTTLTQFPLTGWYEIQSEGDGTIYLCVIDEGMVSGPSDTPANKQYKPRVLNPETFSIKRAPQVWIWGNGSVQQAAFGQLELDNYDGAYNYLLEHDVRDRVVVVKVLAASALLSGTAISSAQTVCTGVIDSVTSDNEDRVLVAIKDTLALLDKTLPVHYNPPFVDEGAANVMVPLTFGACRNIKPLLRDTPNRIYQLHDTQIPNVTLVADKAAPLDPHANPPQYVPALSGSGLQLQTMPQGALTVDCSSYGQQSVIPGADDVLSGAGAFNGAWAGTPLVPPGWTWTNGTGSSITESAANYLGSGTHAASLITAKLWDGSSQFGDSLSYPGILLGGYSYRLNFSVYAISAAPSLDNTLVGGLMVATALSSNPADYISGFGKPIQAVGQYPHQPPQNISYEFTVPPGSTRDLFFILTTSTASVGQPNGSASAAIYNITLEQLGQYQTLPLSGIPMSSYFAEIRARTGNAFDFTIGGVDSRSDGSLIPWGIHFDAPPNILAALQQPLDNFCCALFTDKTGQITFGQLTDPSDPDNISAIRCDFDMTNVARPIQVAADDAKGLTNLIGARRNWFVFGPSDFVTDQTIVPQNIKTQFGRTSQFELTSSVSPTGHYTSAIGAPIFNSLFDLSSDAQKEIDRVVGIYSPKVYYDGTSTNGKRRFITFTAFFDDPAKVGVNTTCAISDIAFGDYISLTYANADGSERFVNQLGVVVEWEVFPFGNKVQLKVMV
jgi:hypothetical protein